MKLTTSQRNVLIAVRFGFLTYDKTYDSYYLYRDHKACPDLHSATLSGRVLARLGLIIVPTNDYPCRITLSEEGEALVEELLTDYERAGLEEMAQREAREGQRQERSRREAAFDEEHRTQTQDWRNRSNDLNRSIHTLDSSIFEAALKIGNGANNVDELLSEIRGLTALKNTAEAEKKTVDAQTNAFWERRKQLFTE